MVFDWLSGRKDAERQARLYAQEKQKLEEEAEMRRAWKQRILTAYNAYIANLALIKFHIGGVYPTEYLINDYGWPDIPHKREAEAFLCKNNHSDYEDWKKCVQHWNGYATSSSFRIEESREMEWSCLLKGRDDFLAKLKQLRDDIDAERVSNGA